MHSLRRVSALFAMSFLLGSGVLDARPAAAFSPFLVVPEAAEAEATPAYRYANMTNEEALAELDRRKVPYVPAEPIEGVRAAVRLRGRLHGVSIHSALPEEERANSVFEVLDARLALALDDFAVLLERHDIDEIVHYSLYRPNVPNTPEKPVQEPVLPKMTKAKETKKASAPAPAPAPASASASASAPASAPVRASVSASASASASAPASAHAKHLPKGTTKELPKVEPKTKTTKPLVLKGHKTKTPAAVEVVKKQELLMGPLPPPTRPVTKIAKKTTEAPRPRASTSLSPKALPVVVKKAPVSRQRWAPPGTRHPAGLAIDVGKIHKKDGTWLSVAGHFQGQLGAKTCGQGVPWPAESEARELRSLVCEVEEQGIFTYILTPNYDRAHADHFHMEIKPGVRWFLVH